MGRHQCPALRRLFLDENCPVIPTPGIVSGDNMQYNVITFSHLRPHLFGVLGIQDVDMYGFITTEILDCFSQCRCG
jgi:hypothetical protein